MANQIRLKRASGSDPGASDLVLGEPAVRTDTGEIFLKKDDGSIAKVAGGIDDGDKGDITVSNSGATFTIDSGVIDNANVASNAAIAGSKISPDFGSQNVATTGTLASSDITIQNSNPGIFLLDTNNNDDFSIRGSSGMFRIRSETDAADRLVVNSDGHVDIGGNLDVGDGLDVTGDVTVTSTAPKISLIDTNANDDFEIKVNAGNFAINDATNSVNRFLIDSSGTVDIGGNLDVGAGIDCTGAITATGDLTITSTVPRIFLTDSNNNSDFAIVNSNGVFKINDQTNSLTRFSIASDGTTTILQNLDVGAGVDVTGNITVSGTVDGRDVATDGSKLDGIASGATNVTNNNQLTNGAGYITSSNSSITNKLPLAGGTMSGDLNLNNNVLYFSDASTTNRDHIWSNDSDNSYNFCHDTTRKGTANSILKAASFQGSGASLTNVDAATLDSLDSSQFLRSDASDVMLGTLTIGDGTGNDHEIRIKKADNNVADHIQFFNGSTRVGEIGVKDTTWLRINQETAKNIYTPRYIRADGGFFVDSTSKGINGSGNFIGGTVTSPTVSVSNGILELKAAIATSHTLTTDYNALAVDPTINNGITVTVPSGAVWAIV